MKAIVFSGTTEGKFISEYLSHIGVYTLVSVATEYGKEVMKDELPYISVICGRLDYSCMLKIISDFECDFVIDATHPYAELVTENIYNACSVLNREYYRIKREETINKSDNCIEVENILSAVEYLKNTDGNIFVATGSKELHLFSGIADYKKRIFARVLPTEEARLKCEEIGLCNVIYEKGPFSFEQNREHFKAAKAEYIVTKSSGKTGGFDEKLKAAEFLNMKTIVVKRPVDFGNTFNEIKDIVDKKIKKG